MARMTVTEAVETIALDVRVWCRQNGAEPTLDLVAGRVSELYRDDTIKGQAARVLGCNGARQRLALASAIKGM